MPINDDQLKIILEKIQNNPDSVTDEEELILLQEMNKETEKIADFLEIVELTSTIKNPNQS